MRDTSRASSTSAASASSCVSRPIRGRTTVGRFVARVASVPRARAKGVTSGAGGARSDAPPRAGSCLRTRSCRDLSDSDGSRPERLVQDLAGAGVDIEGVGLPATSVQRHHQQAGHGLQGGVGGDEGLELGDDLLLPAQREGGLGTFGHRGELELGEAGRLRDGPLLGGEVAQRLARPEGQGVVVGVDDGWIGCGAVLVGRPLVGGTGLAEAGLELVHVDLAWIELGPVAHTFAPDEVLQPDRPECATQLRDTDLQRVHRVHRQGGLRPQPVDQEGGGNGASWREQQLGQQGALSGPGQLRRPAGHGHLHGPEQSESHLVHVPPS